MGLMEWHFKTSTSIVNTIELIPTPTSVSVFTANELKTLILETIKKSNR